MIKHFNSASPLGSSASSCAAPSGPAETLSETVLLAQRLIRFNTTNYGEGRSEGEQEAAEFVADYISALGLQPTLYTAAPQRVSVAARLAGENPELPALVVHGHLDVVPAEAADWEEDPFGGTIKNGELWGRGAVDMKDTVAMMLSATKSMLESGRRPQRDLILVFFADEEAGGEFGSHYMVREHPEVFAGASEAISEVGGYSVETDGRRLYLIQTGEKATLWVKLTATGPAGHGSLLHPNNPVAKLSRALTRIAEHSWPLELTDTTRSLLARIAGVSEAVIDQMSPEAVRALGERLKPFVPPTLQNTANPTALQAGYKHNVVPGSATALVDARPLPGQEDRLLALLQELCGDDARVEVLVRDVGIEFPFSGPLVQHMVRVLQEHDPEGEAVPYLLGGGTDNKALTRLGIKGYGFAPLRMPPELDFGSLFHGVNERVPLDALNFGHGVLLDFLLRDTTKI